jgi:hypothetical protein
MRRTAGIENWAVSLLGGGGGGKETLFIRKGTLFSYHKFCGCGNIAGKLQAASELPPPPPRRFHFRLRQAVLALLKHPLRR